MPYKENEAVVGDCIELMKELPEGSVDLIFADPPFGIGYSYDVYKDDLNLEDYVRWSSSWIEQVKRALKEDGSFWVAIGDERVSEIDVLCKSLGFKRRSWVVWYYTFGVNCKSNFTRSHTHLLYYTKSDSFTFNADDPACRVPSARQIVYGDKRANSKGRLPDNTWILRPQDAAESFSDTEDTWHVSRVAGTFKERAGFHGCQMPTEIMERIIRFCSNTGELVLDPFCGSGTTAVAAIGLGRRIITSDISEDYVRNSNARITRSLEAGK